MNTVYNEEIDSVKKSEVFAEIHTKHQNKLQTMLVALPEEEREAARQRLMAEALLIYKSASR